MSEKKTLLRRLSAVQFALWEINLFLDTHPDCQNAIALCKKYTQQYNELKAEYEKRFGKLEVSCEGNPSRTHEPFPWEFDFEEDN